MRKSNVIRISLLSTIILSILCLISILNVNISRACVYDNTNKTLTIAQNFQLVELAENVMSKNNITSIDIEPPVINWNITDIEMNFTNIKLERETKIIEDQAVSSTYIYKSYTSKRTGLCVQLNISEPTTIYGVYIYGYKTSQSMTNLKFQLRGFDSTEKRPTPKIYSEVTTLNMCVSSGTPMWNYQQFPSAQKLSNGNYTLVMNGSNIGTSSSRRCYWYYVNQPSIPLTPNLYSAYYPEPPNGNSWDVGDVNKTFLYKLDQKVDRTYEPQTINMTVKIDGNVYNVSNGKTIGYGNVSIFNLNLNTNGQPLNVPVYNNNSIQLNFSLNYKIKLKHYFFSNGTVSIKCSFLFNNWTITPNISRYYSYYSVMFFYPSGWDNFTIYKNNINITEPQYVTIDKTNHFIIILNSIISNNANWTITANSPRIEVPLIVPVTTFKAGEKLTFSVNSTGMAGNLTYILCDSNGTEKYREAREIGTNENETVFSYQLSVVPNVGNWNASVYWYNDTDAGYKQQVFQVTSLSGGSSTDGSGSGGGGGGGGGTTTIVNPPAEVPVIDPLFLIFIAIIGSISATAAGASYLTLKKVHRILEAKKQKLLNKCVDVLNLNYVIITDKASGLTIYEQLLAGKLIEGTLISGFLQAIRTFGIELTGAKEESQTIKLEYQDSKILMSDFKNFRLLLIMKDLPSSDFLEDVKTLSYEIEEKFGNLLKDFDGDVRPFREIQTLIEQHLNTPFVYPLKVDTSKIVNTNNAEKILINRATDLMKANELDHFYMIYLMGEKMFTPKDIKTILRLIDKKIFVSAK